MAASLSAATSPMPDVAPVMTQDFPSRSSRFAHIGAEPRNVILRRHPRTTI
jgi:hypothetical protein